MGAVKMETGLYELHGGLMLEQYTDEGEVYPLTECCHAAVRTDAEGVPFCGQCADSTTTGAWSVPITAPDRQRSLAYALLREYGITSAQAWAWAERVWAEVGALEESLAEEAWERHAESLVF